MLLSQLIKGIEYKSVSGPDTEIKSLGHNSKKVTESMLYFCLEGSIDGHDFASEAVRNGACAIVCMRPLALKIPQVLVSDTREAMSLLASAFYGHPQNKLKLIGITGTNGKTTTTHIIKAIAQTAGISCGIIGTSGVYYNDLFFEPQLTTPDPIALHKILAEMHASGVSWVAMEVSAHALALKKIEGIQFDAAVFTNLSQDHLDFFTDLQAYKDAKSSFFTPKLCKKAIINSDDELGRQIINSCKTPFVTYGVDNPSDVFAIDYEADEYGQKYIINCFDDLGEINFRLPGRFNMYNTLCAAATCHALGLSLWAIQAGISSIKYVAGRFNIIDCKNGVHAIIDYAHTPDGLKNVLCAISEFCKGRLICVFGCGGNRDKFKRASMGWISAKHSSYTIVTSDNPRFEEPMDIINDICAGIKAAGAQKYVCIEQRQEAIKYALRIAKKGDIILIAGKGDERTQEIMGEKYTYNDYDVIKQLIGD